MAASFSQYALSSGLSPDATYTVELLLDRVRSQFDSRYWEDWRQRAEAREQSDYRPGFDRDHVGLAAKYLQELTWLSFQRHVGDKGRPIRDLDALRFLPQLTGLALNHNEVVDISVLGCCTELKQLHLQGNPVHDISALANCRQLERLELDETPIEDFTVLETLPRLRKLSLTADQAPVLRRVKRLSHLQQLEFGHEPLESFVGFPAMPELRSLRGTKLKSLAGLEHCGQLENLVNISGEADSLEPLRGLKKLTHVSLRGSRVSSLAPLGGLSALRALWVGTEQPNLDLSPLLRLPALHEVTVQCAGQDCPGLAQLRAALSSWDIEFRSAQPRHVLALELEVVDQETFDFYDSQKPYNVTAADSNHELLLSELDWLDEQLREVFAVDFQERQDFDLPFPWGGARSRTLVLLSERAVESFPRLVLGIQRVLALARNDWIIYLQSDETEVDFIVWIYPEKIMVTEQYAETVRGLIEPK